MNIIAFVLLLRDWAYQNPLPFLVLATIFLFWCNNGRHDNIARRKKLYDYARKKRRKK